MATIASTLVCSALIFSGMRVLLFAFGLLVGSLGISQELPPVVNYSPTDYNAGSQNWSLDQDDQGRMYAANNDGLLVFNGERWTLYPTPRPSVMRSVQVIKDRVYTGAYMHAGYWTRDEFGELRFTTTLDDSAVDLLEDEQIWKIHEMDGRVVYQTLSRVYVQDADDNSKIQVIEANGSIAASYVLGGQLYVYLDGQGLLKLYQGVLTPVVRESDPLTQVIVGLGLNLEQNLQAFTRDGQWFELIDGKWQGKLTEVPVSDLNVYTAQFLADGGLAVGSIAQGLLILNQDGSLRHQYTRNNTLDNNTILSIGQDKAGNVWTGMDSGIACVNLNSRYREFIDRDGKLGSIYAALQDGDKLYLGTNQGLFYGSADSGYELVPGTSGQVWMLDRIDGQVIMGHNLGTFTVTNGVATQVASIPGTWKLLPVPEMQNHYLQGNYDGLYVVTIRDGEFTLSRKLQNMGISAREFVFLNSKTLLLNHEYKGIHLLKLNDALDRVTSDTLLATAGQGVASGLLQRGGKVYYINETGVQHLNQKKQKFEVPTTVEHDHPFLSGRVIQENGVEIQFEPQNVVVTTPGTLQGEQKTRRFPLPASSRIGIRGFENVLTLSDGRYLIGGSQGYTVLDTQVNEQPIPPLLLERIRIRSDDGEAKVSLNQSLYLDPKTSSAQLEFALPDYNKYTQTQYAITSQPTEAHLTNTSTDGLFILSNLPAGNFELNAVAYARGQQSQISGLGITQYQAWYKSGVAIAGYILGGLLLVLGLNAVNRKYYRRKIKKQEEASAREMELERLDREAELAKVRNEALNVEIDARNRELATSTMNVVQKNELLMDIRTRLEQVTKLQDLPAVLARIDKSITSKKDQKAFEDAMEYTDQEFLKRIKSAYPKLTSGDLRLCLYLRLNLSSKEIAPLLNISPRSVEIKRYRLRKKLELTRDQHIHDVLTTM